IVSIPPFESKTMEFTLTPNKYQEPKEHMLFFIFEYKGEQVKIVEQRFEFITLMPAFSVDQKLEKIFLKYFYSLDVKNEGNVKNTQEVKLPISIWQTLFLSRDVKIKSYDDQRYMTWEVSLAPGESTQINYVYNYRIVVYLLVILILFAAFYYVVQNPIKVTKKALTAKTDEKGALSEVKITLDINNHSNRPIREIKITDVVPSIVSIEKSSEMGTVKPQEIVHSSKGTKLVWSIAELEAKEHRVITYGVKAKLNILGTFSLPRATIEFSTEKGKKGKGYSNPFTLEDMSATPENKKND
ncbi:MAG: hypothetical protein AABY27_02970, partial [Pseudomonadota bacterium]